MVRSMADTAAPGDPADATAQLAAEIEDLQQLLGDAAARLLDEQGRVRDRKPLNEARFDAVQGARLAFDLARSGGRLLQPADWEQDDLPTRVDTHLNTYRDRVYEALGAIDGIGDVAVVIGLLGEDAYTRLYESVHGFERWRVQAAWAAAPHSATPTGGWPNGPASEATPAAAQPAATFGGLAATANSMTAELDAAATHLYGIRDELAAIASWPLRGAIAEAIETQWRARRCAAAIAKHAHAAGGCPSAEGALDLLERVSDVGMLPAYVEAHNSALDAMATLLRPALAGPPNASDRSPRMTTIMQAVEVHHLGLQSASSAASLSVSAHVVVGHRDSIVSRLRSRLRG